MFDKAGILPICLIFGETGVAAAYTKVKKMRKGKFCNLSQEKIQMFIDGKM